MSDRYARLHKLVEVPREARMKIRTGFRRYYATSASSTVQSVGIPSVPGLRNDVWFEVGSIDGFDGMLGSLWTTVLGIQVQ